MKKRSSPALFQKNLPQELTFLPVKIELGLAGRSRPATHRHRARPAGRFCFRPVDSEMADGGVDESEWCRRVFAAFEHSVVRLHHKGSFIGTGFMVHWSTVPSKCLIMSCFHVCEDVPLDGTMDAYFSGSTKRSKVKVIHLGSRQRDLALLRVTYMHPEVRKTRHVAMHFFEGPVEPGWNIVMLTYNVLRGRSILQPSTWFGRISSPPHPTLVTYTCTSTAGTSGSPIVLPGINRVLGVHIRRTTSTSSAVGARAIKSFLQELVPGAGLSIRLMLTQVAG